MVQTKDVASLSSVSKGQCRCCHSFGLLVLSPYDKDHGEKEWPNLPNKAKLPQTKVTHLWKTQTAQNLTFLQDLSNNFRNKRQKITSAVLLTSELATWIYSTILFRPPFLRKSGSYFPGLRSLRRDCAFIQHLCRTQPISVEPWHTAVIIQTIGQWQLWAKLVVLCALPLTALNQQLWALMWAPWSPPKAYCNTEKATCKPGCCAKYYPNILFNWFSFSLI